MVGTSFIFHDYFLTAIKEFKNPEDRLKVYEAIAEYAISGTEPVVETTETEDGQATYLNAFKPLYEGIKPQIDADKQSLAEMDEKKAEYDRLNEEMSKYIKQQEEKKSEEQTDTYGKPKTVEV